MSETYTQRLRVTFALDESVKYVGHLDMARTWERAIRRAGLPLAYTQGFNPQPRIQFASALPLGLTSHAELVDVYLNEELAPEAVVERLAAALPPGVRPLGAKPVARQEPSLQSLLVAAHYRVEVETAADEATFRGQLAAFLARGEVRRERRRGKDVTRYDLRPLVLDLQYAGPGPLGQSFDVTMKSEAGATGRPDELLAELGYAEALRSIERTMLEFAYTPPPNKSHINPIA